jgi:hypothetical protein
MYFIPYLPKKSYTQLLLNLFLIFHFNNDTGKKNSLKHVQTKIVTYSTYTRTLPVRTYHAVTVKTKKMTNINNLNASKFGSYPGTVFITGLKSSSHNNK